MLLIENHYKLWLPYLINSENKVFKIKTDVIGITYNILLPQSRPRMTDILRRY